MQMGQMRIAYLAQYCLFVYDVITLANTNLKPTENIQTPLNVACVDQ
jgi:hypothetical protein